MLLKYLSENQFNAGMKHLFLIATPFWSGNEEWKQGLKLKAKFAENLPESLVFHFYHCKDDEEVSFSHLEEYRKRLPSATFREIETGGHQLQNKVHLIAEEIIRLNAER